MSSQSSIEVFSERVDPRIPYRSAATLADEPLGLTCSMTAARQWAQEHRTTRILNGYPSFERAAESVRAGQDEVFIVPSAYSKIDTFFFDRDFRALDSILSQLPDMVLASADCRESEEIHILYHHPATEHLLRLLAPVEPLAQAVSSNSMAARLARKSDRPSAAITNRLCADSYRLQVLKSLATGVMMNFVVFGRRDPE